MFDSQVVEETLPLFPYTQWSSLLPALADQYRRDIPVPHISLTNFLPVELAREAANEFPVAATDAWIHWQHYNEDKHGLVKRELFPPRLGAWRTN
jgi:hypothetical protein